MPVPVDAIVQQQLIHSLPSKMRRLIGIYKMVNRDTLSAIVMVIIDDCIMPLTHLINKASGVSERRNETFWWQTSSSCKWD